jgi:ABC-2 type transport system permease protein
MTAFTTHFSFEFKTGVRNAMLMLVNYLLPLGFYAMMGAVMVKINPGFSAILIPVMIVFTAMSSAILGMPGPIVELRDAGVYRSYKINGVPAFSILAVPVLTTIIHALIASTIIAGTAGPLFGGLTPTNWVALAWASVLTIAVMGALGALIAVVATGARSTMLLGQAIYLPSILIGGMMIPVSMLPPGLQSISGLFPSTYAMAVFQSYAYGLPTVFDPVMSLVVLLAAMLIAFGLALYLFNWDSRNQTRRGHPLMALLAIAPFVVGMILQATK